MTSANTLFRLTTRTHVSDLTSKIVWPGGARPTKFGGDYDALTVHAGYGSAVFVEDAGAFGTHVYLGTGEDVFSDQMTALALHEDNPAWQMFQQPMFALSQSQAQAMDTEWFYNPTEAASLEAAQPWPNNRELPTNWNQTFTPKLSNQGWVLWKKAKLSLGNNRSHSMRYNTPCYIPPSMTGTGDGAIITNDDSFAGPYGGGNGKPGNVGDPGSGAPFPSSAYCADLWPSGNQKVFCRAMNTRTKTWIRLDTAPLDPPKGTEITRNASFVDRASKLVWYKTGDRIYYLDFTNGLASATCSAYIRCPINDPVGLGRGGIDYDAAHCPTEGHPQGRRLMYLKNRWDSGTAANNNALWLVDLDNAQMHVLDMNARGLNFEGRSDVGAGYDPFSNRVFWIYPNAANTAIKCASFEVPSNPATASSYNVTTVTLALGGGVTLESIPYRLHFGRHCQYHRSLGVIVYQQRDHAPLVFRPA